MDRCCPSYCSRGTVAEPPPQPNEALHVDQGPGMISRTPQLAEHGPSPVNAGSVRQRFRCIHLDRAAYFHIAFLHGEHRCPHRMGPSRQGPQKWASVMERHRSCLPRLCHIGCSRSERSQGRVQARPSPSLTRTRRPRSRSMSESEPAWWCGTRSPRADVGAGGSGCSQG